ncbi:hypothetical protein [Caldithrix abyssi]|nr:hypothetical protein [Caldithrix abyssi]
MLMVYNKSFSKRDDDMSELERKKIELIKMRIKNKFYDRAEILERVVSEIIKSEVKKN